MTLTSSPLGFQLVIPPPSHVVAYCATETGTPNKDSRFAVMVKEVEWSGAEDGGRSGVERSMGAEEVCVLD